jgi:hypothetical protein
MAKIDESISKDAIKAEYFDLSENLRHWGNLRFHSLTVFIAVMGGLFALLSQSGLIISSIMLIVLKFMGVVIVIIFWIMDERIFLYWSSGIERIRLLEKELDFRQFSNFPHRGFITSRNAVRLLFMVFCVFWIFFIFDL